MNKEQRKRIKERFVKLMTDLFGIEMGKTVEDFYDENELELIATTCKPLLAHLIGENNAELKIQQIISEELKH
jgi:hypothetical protein